VYLALQDLKDGFELILKSILLDNGILNSKINASGKKPNSFLDKKG
jgi:hypothetical protein